MEGKLVAEQVFYSDNLQPAVSHPCGLDSGNPCRNDGASTLVYNDENSGLGMRSLKLLLQHDKLEFEKQRFPNWSLGTSTTKMFGTLGIRVGRGSGELAERFENNSMLGRMSLVTIRIPKEPIFYLTQRRNVKELNHEICETHKSKVEVLCIFLDFCSRHLESSFSLPSLDAGYRHPCRYDGLR